MTDQHKASDLLCGSVTGTHTVRWRVPGRQSDTSAKGSGACYRTLQYSTGNGACRLALWRNTGSGACYRTLQYSTGSGACYRTLQSSSLSPYWREQSTCQWDFVPGGVTPFKENLWL